MAALKSRAGAIAAATIVFLGIFFVLAGPSWGLALYRLMLDGGCAILWLASAGGFGWIVWKFIGVRENNSLAAISCVGLGLGFLSLLVLALGLAGVLNQGIAIGILAAGDLVLIFALRRIAKEWDAREWFAATAGWGWLWIAAAAVGGVVMLGACFPAGILWGDEPNAYDVVEYHLQVPREWYEAGRIIPLTHNVFSYFPFNVEMHYLLAMYLHGGFGGPWAGMYLAQMMHVGFCAAAVAAVYALVCVGKGGIAAGLLVAATPWWGLLGAVAYNEGGTLLFGTLAIGWAIRGKSWREFLIAGIFAGLAAGTKLSVVPLILAGVPVVIFVSRPRMWAGCGRYVLAAVLVLSPWLIRDWKWTGNPVFPEAMNVLGKGHFSDVQVKRWREAYYPDMKYRSAGGHAVAIWNEVIGDERFGWALFPLGIGAMVIGFRNRTVICLAALLLFQSAFWVLFTHLQSRFMVIGIPIVALTIAQIDRRGWLTLCAAAGMGMAVFSVYFLTEKMGRFLEIAHTSQALIGRENLEGFRMLDTRQLKEGQAVDLVGDACAFWYQIPMSRLHYKTVFDVDTSDPKESIEQAWLAGMPTHDAVVWRDEEELKRFARTYFGIGGFKGELGKAAKP